MAEFVSPWQGFGGVSDFGHEMSSFGLWLLILSLGASISLQQKTATRVGRFLRSTRVAVGYGPRDIGFLCLVHCHT
ncbi:MAG: hypothetical protein JWP89_679 [Schlesneria sp.]|nr:hypothetical protein [Schlesneria sp.]